MTVKFANLRILETNTQEAVLDVLRSGQFIKGKYHKEFSTQWAEICGMDHCIPVASGSAAIISILKALRNMDMFQYYWAIVPTYSFAATAFSVLETEFKLAYCNVNEQGLMDLDHCMDLVRNYKTQDTMVVVMPVYLYGQWFKLPEEMFELAVIVEDACQAHGLKPQGAAACYSFYPSKNLGAAGDAGAIVTNSDILASQVEAYANYGDFNGQKYVHSIYGNNLRMDEIQAAILSSKLSNDRLRMDNEIRAFLADEYASHSVEAITQKENNVHHLFPILVDQPYKFVEIFQREEIEVGRHYPYVLPDIAPGIYIGQDPIADKLAHHVLTLPLGPHMDEEDIYEICDLLHSIAELTDEGMWELK